MSTEARTMSEIEREIEVRRDRLADTIDALAYRAKPQVIAKRQFASLKSGAQQAFRDEQDQVRSGRVVAVAGVLVALVAIGIWRRVGR